MNIFADGTRGGTGASGLGRQRYWRTDHPNAEYADFLKVRWMSVADGDNDGHAVCRGGRTVAAPGKTEIILRLEESYIPA